MRIALLVALAAACSSERPSSPSPSPSPSPPPSPAAPSANGLQAGPPKGASTLLADARQLVVGTVDGWDDVSAEVTRYERGPDGGWRQLGEPWAAAIGAHGAAWGIGLHGQGAPAGQDGPVKIEGDGKSPAGAFSIGASYGYADAPPAGARVAYQKTGNDWLCIDDRASSHYNRVLDTAGVAVDWSSHEDMRRTDDLYRWVLFVDHNPKAEPGAGSCIFLHLWRGPENGTAGCTAMAPAPMEALLAWLDPAAHPAFVLLPADRLAALRAPWGLP